MALTHYEVLGVDQDATRAEITSAFRAQMRALHADAGGDDELAKNVSSAYNVLSNASRRAAYDRPLSPRQSSSPGPNTAPSSPRRPAGATRDRVFTTDQSGPGFSMMSASPAAWCWHVPGGVDDESAGAAGADSRSAVRTVVTILAFVAWVGAGAVAASTLGLLAMGQDSARGTLRLDHHGEAALSWSNRWQWHLYRSQRRVGPLLRRLLGGRQYNPPT